MNEYTFDSIVIGQEESFSREITPEMENDFRSITGDINPLHMDDDFAKSIDPDRFVSHVTFGMLTASLYSTFAGVYMPGKYSLIHSFEDLSFMNPVYAGDTLTVTGKVTDKDDSLKLIRVSLTIRNQSGAKVSKAKMKIIVMK